MGNKNRRFKFEELRQKFRLTPTEKQVAIFIIAAFALGVATKCYRDRHPSPAPVPTHSRKTGKTDFIRPQNRQARPSDAVKATKGTQKSAETLDLSGSPVEYEPRQK